MTDLIIARTEEALTFGGLKELTAGNADRFRTSTRDAMNGCKIIEVDLSQTTFMDCSGLGALIALRKLARDHDGKVRLLNPTPPVLRLFDLMQTGHSFEVVNPAPKSHLSSTSTR